MYSVYFYSSSVVCLEIDKCFSVLFPGGATYFNQSNGYADAAQHIYEIAQEFNDAGDYFPIFGTCLGFQLIIILASGRGPKENRDNCYSYENLPLLFTSGNRNRTGPLDRNIPLISRHPKLSRHYHTNIFFDSHYTLDD